ncbi:MAG: hypothetical protein LC725_00260 [Lentisphaerae bacterium]|nr:hypothetical protein [Lentisphaerota bacterium]
MIKIDLGLALFFIGLYCIYYKYNNKEDDMATTLATRKAAVLERLMAIDGARRGQLSTQYYTHKTVDGRKVRQGPYYVWQRYVRGQKRSIRVSRQQIDRVQTELARGREVQSILDELWAILEKTATQQDEHLKKKPSRSMPPVNVKPKPRSI